jgi:NTE family protein
VDRGVVLSGGAARGAYEAGVVSVLFERLAEQPRSFRAVCGTSVGAIHAAFFVSGLSDPLAARRVLEHAWTSMEFEQVVRFGWRELSGLKRLVTGGRTAASLLDVRPLLSLIGSTFSANGIASSLRAGRVHALTVTATHIPTGRPVVFAQCRPGMEAPSYLGERVTVRKTDIHEVHVAASAAIPLLLRPQRIDGEFYCDGGLRLNTPIGPAVRLGARRVLVVALSALPGEDQPPELGPNRYPSAAFLLGKVMNAFFLDHVLQDVSELELINTLLDDMDALDPGLAARLAARAQWSGRPAYRYVEPIVIRPSVNLGLIAADYLRGRRARWARWSAAGALERLLDTGERGSDLASYLLFDGPFCRELFELGRRDALDKSEALAHFLDDRVERAARRG